MWHYNRWTELAFSLSSCPVPVGLVNLSCDAAGSLTSGTGNRRHPVTKCHWMECSVWLTRPSMPQHDQHNLSEMEMVILAVQGIVLHLRLSVVDLMCENVVVVANIWGPGKRWDQVIQADSQKYSICNLCNKKGMHWSPHCISQEPTKFKQTLCSCVWTRHSLDQTLLTNHQLVQLVFCHWGTLGINFIKVARVCFTTPRS